jgi:hypothetical protein
LWKSIDLRRAIKIKAYTMLLAWGMIFAHSVIPHNHADECSGNCGDTSHESWPIPDNHGTLPQILSHTADLRVCHLSGFIFHQFDQDNLVTGNCDNIIVSPLCRKPSYIPHTAESIVTEHWNALASFRAPPQV